MKVDNDEVDEIEPIKLNCNYELNENPSYLVVKWFMNDNSIYQWIRGQKPSVFVSLLLLYLNRKSKLYIFISVFKTITYIQFVQI